MAEKIATQMLWKTAFGGVELINHVPIIRLENNTADTHDVERTAAKKVSHLTQ
jgi:hypothetical protein